MIRYRNWVVYSELAFDVEMCVWQRFVIRCQSWVVGSESDSLSKLSCPQRISIRCRIVCSAANSWFAVETELSTVNLWFAVETKLTAANVWFNANCVFYSKIVICCRSCIVCSKFVTRCWNCVGCSWVAFATGIVALTAKQFSLPNCAACREPVFAANFYNRPPGQKWLKC
jgi:hypothetical protein